MPFLFLSSGDGVNVFLLEGHPLLLLPFLVVGTIVWEEMNSDEFRTFCNLFTLSIKTPHDTTPTNTCYIWSTDVE